MDVFARWLKAEVEKNPEVKKLQVPYDILRQDNPCGCPPWESFQGGGWNATEGPGWFKLVHYTIQRGRRAGLFGPWRHARKGCWKEVVRLPPQPLPNVG